MTIATTIHLDEWTRIVVEERARAEQRSVSRTGADLIRQALEPPAVMIRDTCPGWRVGLIFTIACAAAFAAGWAARGGV